MVLEPGGPRGNRIDFLATVLSLTDAQKTQATAIFEAAETASTSLRETQATAAHSVERRREIKRSRRSDRSVGSHAGSHLGTTCSHSDQSVRQILCSAHNRTTNETG